MADRDDLSQFLGRKPFRRIRKSSGAEAGMPHEVARERIHCTGCRKFIRYKDVYTVWEFAPGIAWRMRFCKWCNTMVMEKKFDLTEGTEWDLASLIELKQTLNGSSHEV
jgi:hypothetical protein